MCVIIIKPAGEALPDTSTIQDCWTKNPDGAGFMFMKNDKVRIRKGFMTLPELKAAMKHEQINKEHNAILHFRLATSGGTRPGACHPFPVTQNEELLNSLALECKMGIAHNGVLGSGKGKMSDTMLFVQDILSDKLVKDNLDRPSIKALLDAYLKSDRIAVLAKNEIIRFGCWTQYKGCFYSNERFRRRTYYAQDNNYYGFSHGGNWREDWYNDKYYGNLIYNEDKYGQFGFAQSLPEDTGKTHWLQNDPGDPGDLYDLDDPYDLDELLLDCPECGSEYTTLVSILCNDNELWFCDSCGAYFDSNGKVLNSEDEVIEVIEKCGLDAA